MPLGFIRVGATKQTSKLSLCTVVGQYLNGYIQQYIYWYTIKLVLLCIVTNKLTLQYLLEMKAGNSIRHAA